MACGYPIAMNVVDLPEDMLLLVASKLDACSVCSMAQTSSRLRHLGPVARDRHELTVATLAKQWEAFYEGVRSLPPEYSSLDHRRFWTATGVTDATAWARDPSCPTRRARLGPVYTNLGNPGWSYYDTVIDTSPAKYSFSIHGVRLAGLQRSWCVSRKYPSITATAATMPMNPDPLDENTVELASRDGGDDAWLAAAQLAAAQSWTVGPGDRYLIRLVNGAHEPVMSRAMG